MTNDINERVSELGPVPLDNDSHITASGCSGFEPLADLVTQNGFGNLTAALQGQGGGGGTSVINDNTTDSPTNSYYFIANPPSVSRPSEQHAPPFVCYDPLTPTTYFNNSSTVGGLSHLT